MFKIKSKTYLNENIVKLVIYNNQIYKNYLPGQFVILRIDEKGERIPLTIYDCDSETVTVIFLVVGVSTHKLSLLNESDYLKDLVGPLGKPTELDSYKKILVIGGGTGCCISYPIIKYAKSKNIIVDSLIGFKSKNHIILEEEIKNVSNNLFIYTDDGSYGNSGFVTTDLENILKSNYDAVIAIGPLVMMKNVCLITKKTNTKTVVSLNPIMIDGTGMCGCCRVYIDNELKFACVDGPDFDGFKVDFDEIIKRNNFYKEQEAKNYKRHLDCNLLRGVK